jgi:uncharacterized membrane protein HdeD (DUF308 family)
MSGNQAAEQDPAIGGDPGVRPWVAVLLGVVFIAVGIIALGNTVAATMAGTMVIGLCALVAGGFEVAHAFWTKGWGGFLWHILLGLLSLAAGIVLLANPVEGSLVLTYVFGFVLIASGVLRAVLGIRLWKLRGWVLLLSGTFGILAGVAILAGWPYTGLWVIGFVLGIDFILHGAGWLAVALVRRMAG